VTVEERLSRIEAKLDALLEALEGEETEVETVEVVTMDGQRMAVPTGGEWL
jgi:hypothetical protein